MKKIPLIISTLTLAATGTGALATSLPDNAMTLANAVPTMDSERATADQNLLTTNQFDMRAKIDNIEFDMNRISITSSMLGTGNYTRRILMVYRDYENGVTEEMADKRWQSLGKGDSSDWAVTLVDYDAGNTVPAEVKALGVKTGHTVLENKTDMIYYAVEVAPLTRENGRIEWGEGYWIRGKADYRHCIHSEAYQDNAEMYCLRQSVTDNDGVKWNKYALYQRGNGKVEMPENEQIITWEEEWRQIQLERYESLIGRLGTLDNDVRNATKLMDETQQGLTQLKRTLQQTSGMETQLAGVGRAERTLTSLRSYYEELKNSGGVAEMDSLRAEVGRLQSEVGSLTVANQALTAEKTAWEAERLEMQERLRVAEEAKGALEQEKQGLQEEIVRLKAELAQSEEKPSNCPTVPDATETTKPTVDGEEGPTGGDKEEASEEDEAVATEPGRDDQKEQTTVESSSEEDRVLDERKISTDAAVVPAQTINREVGKMTRMEEQETAQTKMENNTEKMTNGQNLAPEAENPAEIPNLGGEATKSNGWWWLVAILMGAGSCVWWLKRRFADRKVRRLD